MARQRQSLNTEDINNVFNNYSQKEKELEEKIREWYINIVLHFNLICN